jgi:hypothetical protein
LLNYIVYLTRLSVPLAVKRQIAECRFYLFNYIVYLTRLSVPLAVKRQTAGCRRNYLGLISGNNILGVTRE